jgi:hypothetical protein
LELIGFGSAAAVKWRKTRPAGTLRSILSQAREIGSRRNRAFLGAGEAFAMIEAACTMKEERAGQVRGACRMGNEHQRAKVNGYNSQLSAVSFQQSAFSSQLSAVSFQQSAFSSQLSVEFSRDCSIQLGWLRPVTCNLCNPMPACQKSDRCPGGSEFNVQRAE